MEDTYSGSHSGEAYGEEATDFGNTPADGSDWSVSGYTNSAGFPGLEMHPPGNPDFQRALVASFAPSEASDYPSEPLTSSQNTVVSGSGTASMDIASDTRLDPTGRQKKATVSNLLTRLRQGLAGLHTEAEDTNKFDDITGLIMDVDKIQRVLSTVEFVYKHAADTPTNLAKPLDFGHPDTCDTCYGAERQCVVTENYLARIAKLRAARLLTDIERAQWITRSRPACQPCATQKRKCIWTGVAESHARTTHSSAQRTAFEGLQHRPDSTPSGLPCLPMVGAETRYPSVDGMSYEYSQGGAEM